MRVHFNLADINVDPAARLRLIVDVCCTNHGGDVGPDFATGPISFAGLFNDIEILSGATSGTDNQEETFTSAAFTAASVSAVTGENIIDFTAADVEVTPGTPTTLNWTVDPSASVSIDQGIGDVGPLTVGGAGSLEVTPAAPSTTYTLTSTRGADVATATVTVGANNFACLWQVGDANGNSNDFVQENGTSNDPPGDPVNKDDDWYFAGIYPDPIGIMAADEPLTDPDNTQGFERALLVGDPTNRIHFNLDDANAFPTTDMRLTVATAGSSLGEWQGFMGPIEFTASYNGNEVLSSTVTGNALELHQGTFTAGDVGATTGENVIEITRKTDAGGAWMLFDYIKLETEPGAQDELRITDIAYDNETGDVTVTWVSRVDQRYIIETSTDLGIAENIWGDFNDSFLATSELSSETIPYGSFALPEGTKRFFVRVREGE